MDGISTAAMTAVFLAAMAVGAYLTQYHRRSKLSPLLLFTGLEAGLSLFAFFSEPVIRTVSQAMGHFTLHPFSYSSYVIDFFVLSVLFAIPACALGAALPLFLTATASGRDYHRKTASLYGLSALGGTVGVFYSGLYSIGTFGVRRTLMGVALVQGLYALLALGLGLGGLVGGMRTEKSADLQSRPSELWKDQTATLALAFGLGFIAISYQILYFRIATYFFSCTSYVAPTTFVSYLALLTLGYYFSSTVPSRTILAHSASWALLSSSVIFLAPYLFYVFDVPLYHVKLYSGLGWSAVFKTIGISLLLFVPVFFLAGIAPALFAQRTEHLKFPLDHFGGFASAQGLGGFAGALITALVFIPFLGTVWSFRATLFLLALVSFLINPKLKLGRLVATVLVFFVAFAVAHPSYLKLFADSNWRSPVSISEDLLGTIFVYDEGRSGQFVALIGSEGVADFPKQDQSREIFPLDLVQTLRGGQTIRNALVIGLGRGDPALVLKAVYPQAKVQVIELLPSVVRELERANSPIAQEVLPQLAIGLGDGRRFLNRAEAALSEKYDLIQIGVLNASAQGAGNLYSQEAFQKVAGLLSEKGVVTFRGYPPAIRAAQRVFRSVSGASGGKTGMAHGIAANFIFADSISLDRDYRRIRSLFAEKLAASDIGEETHLDSFYFPESSLSGSDFQRILPQTDDLPATEYFLSQATSLGAIYPGKLGPPLFWGQRGGAVLLRGSE